MRQHERLGDWTVTNGRTAAFALFVVGLLLTFGDPVAVAGVLPGTNAAWTVAGAVLSAVGVGIYEHAGDREAYDERQLLVRYRSAYVAFYATFWLVAAFALVTYDADAPPVDPATALVIVLVFGLAVRAGAREWYRRRL